MRSEFRKYHEVRRDGIPPRPRPRISPSGPRYDALSDRAQLSPPRIRQLNDRSSATPVVPTYLLADLQHRFEPRVEEKGLASEITVVLEALERDGSTRHIPVHVVSVHDFEQVAPELCAVGYVFELIGREELVSVFQHVQDLPVADY